MDNNELKKKNLEAGLENFIESFNIDEEAPNTSSEENTVEITDDKITQKDEGIMVTNNSKNADDNSDSMPATPESITIPSANLHNDVQASNGPSEANKDSETFSQNVPNQNNEVFSEPGLNFFENFNEVFEDVDTESIDIETSQVVGEPLFSTFEIADELGITPQTIRNYVGYFKDFLNVEKDERGHAHFTAQDVETLKLIIDLRREKKLSKEKIREYLQNDGNIAPIVSPQPKTQNNTSLSKEMLSSFADYLNKLFTESLGGFRGDVNKNFSSVKDILGSMKETIKSQEEVVKEQGNIIQNQKDEIKRLNEVILALKNITKDSKASIETIKATTKDTNELIDVTKKEMIDAINNGNNNDTDAIAKALSSEYKSTTAKISDKLNENKQAISNLSRNVEMLSKNSSNTSEQSDNESLKATINNSIEQNNSLLYKNIHKENEELVQKLTSLLGASNKPDGNNNLEQVIEEMNIKFEKAEKTIRALADKNSELNAMYEDAIKSNDELDRKLKLSTELIRRLRSNQQ